MRPRQIRYVGKLGTLLASGIMVRVDYLDLNFRVPASFFNFLVSEIDAICQLYRLYHLH